MASKFLKYLGLAGIALGTYLVTFAGLGGVVGFYFVIIGGALLYYLNRKARR